MKRGLGFAICFWFSGAAAQTLYVDARSGAGGDGTAASPFSTIGAALVAASDGSLIIVARGTYQREPRPLVVSKSVRIVGATVFHRQACVSKGCTVDGRGLIDAVDPQNQTVLRAAPPLHDGEALVRIEASGVTLSGFVLDGGSDGLIGQGAAVVLVDGRGGALTDFTISDDWVLGAWNGIRTRFASGRITGNLIGSLSTTANSRVNFGGAEIAGGSPEAPAVVVFDGNRATGNWFAGVGAAGDSETLVFPPIATSAGGATVFTAFGNDVSRNGITGFIVNLRGLHVFSDVNLPASISADIHDNRATGNGLYGIMIHSPQGAHIPGEEWCPPAAAVAAPHLADNDFSGNGVNRVLYTYTAIVRTAFGEPSCYLHASTVVATDLDDPQNVGFDWDAPDCDPDAPDAATTCTPLDDHLTVNGTPVAGRKIGP